MKDGFDSIIKAVREKFAALAVSPTYSVQSLPKDMPEAGIYLFSEGGKSLYVGRTNNLRKRLRQHTHNNPKQAAFAFLLARCETGRLKASYKPGESRTALFSEPIFRTAFNAALTRITEMDVKYVEESDQVKQTILEVFTAFQTKAEFNDFSNR